MSDINFNLSPSFVPTPQTPASEARTGATGPISPQAVPASDARALGDVRKGAIPATGDRLSLTVSPTSRGADVLPPDTALVNAIHVMIQQAPVRALASSIGLTTTLAAAIKEAPGIVHHGEPDEDLNEAEAVEDEDEPQAPGLRRAPMRVGKGSKDEEGALSSF